jgi:hypothetical protein
MLNFPDFAKEFHVFTDASDYQLGGVIMTVSTASSTATFYHAP